MSVRSPGSPLMYLAALGLTAVAVLLRWGIDPWLQDQLPFVTLFGAVAIAVWFAGWRPATLVAVLGYIACAGLFVETRRVEWTYTLGDVLGLVAYLVSCGAIIGFGEGMSRAQHGERARAEVLRVTFASIGDAVITTDEAGGVTFLNSVAEALTGWQQQDARGQPIETVFNIIDADTQLPVDNPARRAILEGRSVGLANHTSLVARDGSQRLIDDTASPIRDSDDVVSGAVLIFRDVSERRRAQLERDRTAHALRASVERFRLAQRVARIGTFEWDIRTGVNAWTPELEAIHGLSPGSFAGTREAWEAILHPDDRVAAVQHVQQAMAGPGLAEAEWRILRPDGSVRWISGSAVVLNDDEGRPARLLGVNIDVTDRKHAEEATARLAAIVASSSDAILSKDLDGRITSWNRGATELFGYETHEIVGRSVKVLIPEGRHDEEPEILARIASGQRVDHYETVRQRKDGTLVDISLTVSPVFDGTGRVVGASKIARDITEQKRVRIALKEADRRKDEFLATLAHELRTPLAPIRNALAILKRAEAQPAMLEQTRAMMERQIEQMVRLIDDLMDVSRISRGRLELRLESASLAAVMQQAVETCRPMVEAASHTLVVSWPSPSIRLRADPIRLAQVFSNLLSNACKFTPPGGSIHFTAESGRDSVVVRVRDNGVGLRQEEIPRIFEMFSQVDNTLERSQGGLGLGLSLSKRLVELHGGTLEVQSGGPDRGSEFIVHLPTAAGASGIESAQAQSIPDVTPLRILVVDDSRDSAESLSVLLGMHGHDTRTAYDGLEAVETAGRFRPQIVLLDIGLPRLNGYDACRRIREQSWGKTMTLIAVTGWGQDEDKRRALDAGFDGHLVKPVDYQALLSLLASIGP